MRRFGSYRIGFDICGLVLFLLVMIPNLLWFAVPAPNDILRSASATPNIDVIASVLQTLLVATLCFVIPIDRPTNRRFTVGIAVLVFAYFVGWVTYYLGFTHAVVILDLCIAPCLAFLLFSVARQNWIAALFTIGFLICDTLYGIINFL